MENQLTILSESLDKKLEVLQKIREYNKRQEEIFSAEEVDMSLFDDAVEENSGLLMRWFIWMKALKSCMRSWQGNWKATENATQHRSGNFRRRSTG